VALRAWQHKQDRARNWKFSLQPTDPSCPPCVTPVCGSDPVLHFSIAQRPKQRRVTARRGLGKLCNLSYRCIAQLLLLVMGTTGTGPILQPKKLFTKPSCSQ